MTKDQFYVNNKKYLQSFYNVDIYLHFTILIAYGFEIKNVGG